MAQSSIFFIRDVKIIGTVRKLKMKIACTHETHGAKFFPKVVEPFKEVSLENGSRVRLTIWNVFARYQPHIFTELLTWHHA